MGREFWHTRRIIHYAQVMGEVSSAVKNRKWGRKSLPSNPKKRIPPKKKKKKFGMIKTGKNKKSPVSQVNTMNA